MNDKRIKEVWCGFGKLIELANVGADASAELRGQMVAILQQFGQQSGDVEQYDDFQQVVIPLETQLLPTVSTLDRIPTQALVSAQKYIRVIGTELGQPTTATTSAILDAFKAGMIAHSETIAPSGALFNYFAGNFGYSAFPTSHSPTIPDDWITSVVFDPDVTPPSAPQFTVDNVEAAEGGTLVSWADADSGSSNVDKYRINRRINGGAYSVILTTDDESVTNYVDEGTAVGDVVHYQIQAHNRGGWSDYSDERSTTSQGPN